MILQCCFEREKLLNSLWLYAAGTMPLESACCVLVWNKAHHAPPVCSWEEVVAQTRARVTIEQPPRTAWLGNNPLQAMHWRLFIESPLTESKRPQVPPQAGLIAAGKKSQLVLTKLKEHNPSQAKKPRVSNGNRLLCLFPYHYKRPPSNGEKLIQQRSLMPSL